MSAYLVPELIFSSALAWSGLVSGAFLMAWFFSPSTDTSWRVMFPFVWITGVSVALTAALVWTAVRQ